MLHIADEMSTINQPQKANKAVQIELASLACGWILWYFGNPDKNLPPYKDLHPRDFSQREDREMLSNLGFVIRSFHRHILDQLQTSPISDPARLGRDRIQYESFIKNPQPDEARRIYQHYLPTFLAWIQNDETYRMRRTQLEWNTFMNELRYYKT